MGGRDLPVTVVNACLRDGRGGSPTAIVAETSLTDAERRAIPVAIGTSHAVFVSGEAGENDRPAVSLRFFTAAGELPACGHGTIAALAVLADRAGVREYEVTLRTPGRTLTGRATADGLRITAAFDPGPVALREPGTAEREYVLAALGIDPAAGSDGCRVAVLGRPRMLVPVATREHLLGLVPDLDRLRAACDRLGLLGCYVYTVPSPAGRSMARMFAPSIGVPEDIANANGTACLAAHLAHQGITAITVDMGDTLGEPATITATAQPTPMGTSVRVGGVATVTRPRQSDGQDRRRHGEGSARTYHSRYARTRISDRPS